MKKIINNKMYNTETATEIASRCEYGRDKNNFRQLEESLYCKRTGEYFLAGEGGPLTKYREQCDDASYRGENIFPISQEEARQWMEEYGSVEEYIEWFGEPEE